MFEWLSGPSKKDLLSHIERLKGLLDDEDKRNDRLIEENIDLMNQIIKIKSGFFVADKVVMDNENLKFKIKIYQNVILATKKSLETDTFYSDHNKFWDIWTDSKRQLDEFIKREHIK